MATITLKPTGQKMPLVGFGLWKVPRPQTADVVYNALKLGYRLLDGAGDYGNEKEAGEGLARAIKDGIVKRDDVFIVSKLWNTFHAPEHVAKMARYQLKLWGIDHFDLFHIHFPVALKYVDPEHRYPPEWLGDDKKTVELDTTPIQATYEAMEKLVEEGLVKNIGLSNFNGSLILDVVRYAKIRPAVLQIEHHPYLVQQPLLNLAKSLDLAVTAYCSFGPASWIELNMYKHVASLFEHSTVNSIASKHGKNASQILLRWATQRGIAVIPKSNDHGRAIANLNHTDFNLEEEDIKVITGLDQGLRFNDPSSFSPYLSIFA